MSRRYPTPLVWFAVLGGGLAWAVQFVANLFLTFSRCSPGDGNAPLHPIEIGLSVAAIAVGLAANGVAVYLFRETAKVDDTAGQELRGLGSPPPVGRVNSLAAMGMLINTLALTIVVMTAVGAPLLRVCQQA